MSKLHNLREKLIFDELGFLHYNNIEERLIESKFAKERCALTNWICEADFDLWVELELEYNKVKHLNSEEKLELIQQILNTTTNILDRTFFGNKAQRKNQRNTQFRFIHKGRTGTNPHLHLLVASDKRVNLETYKALLTNVMRYYFDETTNHSQAVALKREAKHAARYVTHEYAQLGTDTIDLATTHINNDTQELTLTDAVARRISRLKLKILRKALTQLETTNATEAKYCY